MTSLFIFFIGLSAGFMDSTVGSGGLISIPLLIFFGLPPQVAIATDRLGSVGQTLSALFVFWKEKKIRWNFVFVFTLLAITGSLIGSHILLSFNPKYLQKIVGILLLVLLPLLFIKRRLGVKSISTSIYKKCIGFFNYFLIMIYNGFFGTGAGPFSQFNSLYFFGFTVIESGATGIIPWFFLSITSLIVFIRGGIVDWHNGIVLLIGMAFGGFIGAHIAVTKGEAWIKKLFVLIVIISALKLLF